MRKTFAPSETKIVKNWIFIDAKNNILGKVAEKAAVALMGKNKPEYAPNAYIGDKVVITNAEKIAVTGNKLKDKTYYWHTSYPKGLRSETLEKRLARKPELVLENAIKGMLPKNKLRKRMLSNLYIYAGETHPHKVN